MTVASKVGGLDRWRRQVKAIPVKVLSNMKAAQRQNAQDLAAAIKPKVPRRTGKLQASVDWSEGLPPRTTSTQAFRIDASKLSDLDAARVEAGLKFCVYAGDDKAFGAAWVEQGTKAGVRKQKMRKSGKVREINHPGTKPQPFFWPTIRAHTKRLKSRAARAANKALKEVTTV